MHPRQLEPRFAPFTCERTRSSHRLQINKEVQSISTARARCLPKPSCKFAFVQVLNENFSSNRMNQLVFTCRSSPSSCSWWSRALKTRDFDSLRAKTNKQNKRRKRSCYFCFHRLFIFTPLGFTRTMVSASSCRASLSLFVGVARDASLAGPTPSHAHTCTQTHTSHTHTTRLNSVEGYHVRSKSTQNILTKVPELLPPLFRIMALGQSNY